MKIKIKNQIACLVILSLLTACNSNQTETYDSPDLSTSSQSEVNSPDIDKGDHLATPDLDAEEVNEYHLGSFTATTLAGDEISDSIFEDYQVTMVNVWATWCSPCVKEMPYLQDLYAMLPESMNLITICSDASTQEELANTILEDAGAEFHTIISNDETNNKILSRISAFPTSIFVDSKGEIIHAVEGVPNTDDVANVYLILMEEIQAFLNGEVIIDENISA